MIWGYPFDLGNYHKNGNAMKAPGCSLHGPDRSGVGATAVGRYILSNHASPEFGFLLLGDCPKGRPWGDEGLAAVHPWLVDDWGFYYPNLANILGMMIIQ